MEKSPSLSPIEKWITGSVLLLLVYSAWARGGTNVPLQWFLPWLGLFLFAVPFVTSWFYRTGDKSQVYGLKLARNIIKDPVFFLGALFLLLLLTQWWNAGRFYIYDVELNCWRYSDPRVASLPSAVTKMDAAEMLRWFFPAWAVLIALRSGFITARAIMIILMGLTVNASIIVLFGIFQYMTGTQSIFWIVPLKCHFFASFGYANHAGAFFVLMLSVALGILVRSCFRSYRKRKFSKSTAMSIAMCILLLAGANLSLSRAGIIFSWILVVFAVGYAIWVLWHDMRRSVRLNLIVASAAVLCIGYFVVAGFGKDLFRESLEEIRIEETEGEVSERFWQTDAAVRIWQDNKWFGVGGWGYRYFCLDYVDAEMRQRANGIGKANVHNDPLQFLAEFGLVGFLAMSGGLLCLFVPIWRKGIRFIGKPWVLYPLLGLTVVFMHSLVDLPFRSPAILYHWLVILVAIPYLDEKRKEIKCQIKIK